MEMDIQEKRELANRVRTYLNAHLPKGFKRDMIIEYLEKSDFEQLSEMYNYCSDEYFSGNVIKTSEQLEKDLHRSASKSVLRTLSRFKRIPADRNIGDFNYWVTGNWGISPMMGDVGDKQRMEIEFIRWFDREEGPLLDAIAACERGSFACEYIEEHFMFALSQCVREVSAELGVEVRIKDSLSEELWEDDTITNGYFDIDAMEDFICVMFEKYGVKKEGMCEEYAVVVENLNTLHVENVFKAPSLLKAQELAEQFNHLVEPPKNHIKVSIVKLGECNI